MRCRLPLLVAGFIAAMAVFVSPSPEARADESLVVSPDVMTEFAEYKARRKPLSFAVSKDGLFSWYVYCEGYNCQATQNYRRDAITRCEEEGGTECVIFAVGDEVQIEYRVGDRATMVPANAEPCAVDTIAAGSAASAVVAAFRGRTCSAFRRYGYYADFKAYATSDPAKFRVASGWGYRYDTAEAAIKTAMDECAKSQKALAISDPCELLAVGDIFVRGMSAAEQRAAAEIYKKNKDATNADLPPPG